MEFLIRVQLTNAQDLLTPLNTPGFMLSQLLSLAGASLLLRRLELPVWYRQVISSVLFFALDLYLVWPLKRLLAWVICSVFSVSALAYWLVWLLWASPLRS